MTSILNKIEVVLDNDDILHALNGEWTKGPKMDVYSQTDGCSVEKAGIDAKTGGIGEVAAHKYCKGLFECRPPFFGHLPQDKKIWGNDLITGHKAKIETAAGDVVEVSKHICVKGQLDSQARKYDLSWTFEYEISADRGRDPLLKEPNAPVLVIGAHIMNVDTEGYELVLRMMKTCKVILRFFYWPEVSEFVKLPRIERLQNKKRCIYKDDVDHLQSRFV